VFALATSCDIRLGKAISGADNPAGDINALRLKDALRKPEDAMDGKVVHYAMEFEGVKISEDGFGQAAHGE
jgi:hypothetical protein